MLHVISQDLTGFYGTYPQFNPFETQLNSQTGFVMSRNLSKKILNSLIPRVLFTLWERYRETMKGKNDLVIRELQKFVDEILRTNPSQIHLINPVGDCSRITHQVALTRAVALGVADGD